MISLTIIVWTKFRLLYCYMNVHTCPRLSGPYEKKTISIIQSWNWPDVPQFDCLVLAVAYKVSPVPLWVEECDSVNVAWKLNISQLILSTWLVCKKEKETRHVTFMNMPKTWNVDQYQSRACDTKSYIRTCQDSNGLGVIFPQSPPVPHLRFDR